MSLKFNTDELRDLMENFYTLTGIRIVLFDENYKEIFSYPEECSSFCALLRQNAEFYNLCCKSDILAFESCKKTGKLTMYKCHAGLVEATSPITHNGSIVGYIMFGQVADSKEKECFSKKLSDTAKKYSNNPEIDVLIDKIKFKSKKQLIASSKILEACASYILLKEIVKPSRMEFFSRIDNYITEHLEENITVSMLCSSFNISRTRLYTLCSQYLPCGIASYIKNKRLTKAKELLSSTDLSVTEISRIVGFSDYNYFLKSFKKHFGQSTKSVRKINFSE